MRENETTTYQIGEFMGDSFRFFLDILLTLDSKQVELLVKKKRLVLEGFKKVINDVLGVTSSRNDQDLIAERQKFYADIFGRYIDLSGLVVPPKPEEGDWWLIVVAPNLTYNKVISCLRKLFCIWSCYNDLDKIINISKEQRRTTTESYAIWVRANVEADSDNANISANNLVDTSQITLMERLLLEGIYFSQTGNHLDINNTTLCAGSLSLDGGVPSVNWCADDLRLDVDWYCSDVWDSNIRSRKVFY